MKRHGPLAVLCCTLACGSAAAAEWGMDADAGLHYSDNVPNAIEAGDKKTDAAATLSLSGLMHRQIGDDTGLGLSLVAESAGYTRFSGLNYVGVGANAQLRHKFGLGAEAPWTAFALRAVHRDYHYDSRDGWEYDAGWTVGRRIGERWDVNGSVRYDRYQADRFQQTVLPGVSTAAYDVAGWTFGVQAAWLWTEVDTLSVSASRRHGSVTAVTRPDFKVLEYSSAVARDPVFSGNPIAYRINADTSMLAVNWSRAVGRHASFNLGYAFRRTQGNDELDAYTANMFDLSVSYRR
jgi:hypothetical protein